MAIKAIHANEMRAAARDREYIALYRCRGGTDVDIVASVLPADEALTLVAQPTSPLKLLFNITDGDSSITALDADIVGVDSLGAAVTETLSLDNSGSGGTISVTSANAYARITSITLKNMAGAAGADRVKVGTALEGATDFDMSLVPGAAAGDWIRRDHLSRLAVMGRADQASDASGVIVEESLDGSTVDLSHVIEDEDGEITVGASKVVLFIVKLTLPYFRFRWQNGATDQAVFEIDVRGYVDDGGPFGGPVRVDLNAGVTGDVEPALAAADGLVLMGYSVRESDGTPAAAAGNITLGATAGADDAIVLEMDANAMADAWYGPDGIDARDGISIDHVAGTFDLTLLYKRT